MKPSKPQHTAAVRALALALLTLAATATASARLVGMGEENDSVDYQVIADTGLPVMEVVTVGGEWPTAEFISAPGGYSGKSIINPTKVPARMTITDQGTVTYDSGEYTDGVSGITIRLRGNSSAYLPKKPYKITLQQKEDLLRRNSPSYRDKDWVLLRDDFLKAMIGFELNRMLGMAWTPGYTYVNLIINNEYQGPYMLVESVKRNTSCRLSVTSQGFVAEIDSYWWAEDFYYRSPAHGSRNYTFKYPKAANLTTADKKFIREKLKAFDESVVDGTFHKHLDVESMAKWCLGQDILGTSDAGGVNLFITLNDREPGTRFVVPMMWDFDSSEEYINRWSRPHIVSMKRYLESDNKSVLDAYIAAWEQVRPNLSNKMLAVMARFNASRLGQGYVNSIPLQNLRWGNEYDGPENINERGMWFVTRVPWLDNAIDKLHKRGDVNYDGMVDIDDANLMINMLLRKWPTYHHAANLNDDKVVDVDDLGILLNIITRHE